MVYAETVFISHLDKQKLSLTYIGPFHILREIIDFNNCCGTQSANVLIISISGRRKLLRMSVIIIIILKKCRYYHDEISREAFVILRQYS